jgi:hypothetical protein
MKHLLAVWHSGGKGKSETMRNLATNFISLYPSAIAIYPPILPTVISGDFRLIIEIIVKGKKLVVGFESQGDPGTHLEKRLKEIVINYKCDLLFTTCRTRGETVHAVENTVNSFGYELIWTSTYQLISKPNQIIANQQKALHIIQLLQALSII